MKQDAIFQERTSTLTTVLKGLALAAGLGAVVAANSGCSAGKAEEAQRLSNGNILYAGSTWTLKDHYPNENERVWDAVKKSKNPKSSYPQYREAQDLGAALNPDQNKTPWKIPVLVRQ